MTEPSERLTVGEGNGDLTRMTPTRLLGLASWELESHSRGVLVPSPPMSFEKRAEQEDVREAGAAPFVPQGWAGREGSWTPHLRVGGHRLVESWDI